MEKILFILDRPHGEGIKGKQSPDGSFIEWESGQNIIDLLAKDLEKLNIPHAFTVTGKKEPGLSNRVKKANELSKGVEIPILISPHHNGGGGTGNELFIPTSPSEENIEVANIFSKRLIKDFPEFKWRQEHPDELFKKRDFTVIAGTDKISPNYLGILIEFLFMDTESDLESLKDEKVIKKYVDSLLFAIVETCKHFNYGNFLTP